ncbi:macro domain-containing protein [Acrocarpospora sp. B8E8]|uniref:macro domain-containing protein n=1 Tax=Acrocarpospora sp. B8E8 TaxID=3153572 RepID=UPI00325DA607
MISYVTGDATTPSGDGPKIICHVCNDIGGWGRGFVVAVSQRWPQPEAAYRDWYRDRQHNDFGLGKIQLISVEEDLWVANMVGQHDIRGTDTTPPIRYEAVDSCLDLLATHAAEHDATVHMPRIGCGLAGGTWDRVEPLIIQRLIRRGIAVTVYDLAE